MLESFSSARREGFEQNVGARNQAVHHGAALGTLEVDAQAALVAIDDGGRGAAVAWPEMIAVGRLDLDDLGAKFGE